MGDEDFEKKLAFLLDDDDDFNTSLGAVKRNIHLRKLLAQLYQISTLEHTESRKLSVAELSRRMNTSYSNITNWLNQLSGLGIYGREKGKIIIYREGKFTTRIKKAIIGEDDDGT